MAELKLTALQQRFLVAIIEGATPMQAIKAARGPRGYKASEKTLRNEASRMMGNTALRDALARAHDELQAKAELTVLNLVDQLMETRQIAQRIDPPQLSAAVAATMGAAKLLGLVIDRSEVLHAKAKPALLPTKELELSEDEWRRQFAK